MEGDARDKGAVAGGDTGVVGDTLKCTVYNSKILVVAEIQASPQPSLAFARRFGVQAGGEGEVLPPSPSERGRG
jgi:hypothetical protein